PLLSPNETTKPIADVSPPENTKKQSPTDLDTGGATDEEDGGDAAYALADVEGGSVEGGAEEGGEESPR
nr:hypothetical protein [Tanacetum cinerariifolium]